MKITAALAPLVLLLACDPYADLPPFALRPVQMEGSLEGKMDTVLLVGPRGLELQGVPEREAEERIKELKSFSQVVKQLTPEEKATIESIRIISAYNLVDVKLLSEFPKLTDLYVSLGRNNDIAVERLEIEVPPSLGSFSISAGDGVPVVISGKSELVKTVQISNCGLTRVPDLTAFPSLLAADLSGNPLKDFSQLGRLSQLNTLSVSGDLSRLSEAVQGLPLKYLKVFGSGGADVTWLGGMNNLISVWFEDTKFRDYGYLNQMTGLQEIKIDAYRRSLTVFPDFSGLPQLKSLVLNAGGFEDISALRRYHNLENLQLRDGRFRRIEGIKESFVGKMYNLGLYGDRIKEITRSDYDFLKAMPVERSVPEFPEEVEGLLMAVDQGLVKIVD